MREYYLSITWRNKGTGYERTENLRVKATSLRGALGKALAPAATKERIGWRAPAGAVFNIKAIVGARCEA